MCNSGAYHANHPADARSRRAVRVEHVRAALRAQAGHINRVRRDARALELSRGTAFGDIDNDGDIDVLVTNNGGPARLLRNDTAAANHWVQVQLAGVKANRQGLGARVGVRCSDGSGVWRRARTDGSYVSASDPRVHIGLGATSRFQALIVEWPDGSRETWSGLRPERILLVRQHTGVRQP